MKQSKRSFNNRAATPKGRRRHAARGGSSTKLTVIIAAALAVLTLAASGIYAWFSAEKQYIEGQIDIGTMEVGIHVFKYEGALVELDGADDNPAHTGQSTADSEGVIVHDTWGADSAGVRYIAIENLGTIDVKSYLTLSGVLGEAFDENHARHDRQAGEVPLEEEVVLSEETVADRGLALFVRLELIDEDEGRAVRQILLYVAVHYSRYFLMAMTPLCPPKPREPERAASMSPSTPLLGT